MKSLLSLLLLLPVLLFSQNNKVEGRKYVTYISNACKGNFSSYFYKELEFKKDTIIISDFHTRDNGSADTKYYTKSVKYKYTIEKENIAIIGSEIKSVKIQEHSLVTNSNQIFNEVSSKLNGKKYAGCHGFSCNKTIGGGYMSSNCMIFDFSEKTVTVTFYEKRSNSEEKYSLLSNVYSYEIKDNIIYIEKIIYKTIAIEDNRIIAKDEGYNGEFKDLVFDEIKR